MKLKVEELIINTIIKTVEEIKINDNVINKFTFEGLKSQYAVLGYEKNKKLLINPKHIIEKINDEFYIRLI